MWDYLFQTLSNYRHTAFFVFFIGWFLECRRVILVSGTDQLRMLVTLPGKLNETSGLALAVDGTVYVHNDSGDLGTDIYRLPTEPGSYPALYTGHFNTRGLVTAADFLPGARNTLVLLGYETGHTRNKTFVWIASGIEGTHFLGGSWQRRDLVTNLQAEAILFTSDSTLLMTNEEEGGQGGKIYELRPTIMGDSLK